MKIFLLESFYGGSHKYWADNFKKYSKHSVTIFKLPAKHWKWRMQGSALELARQINLSNESPDLFLVSEMIDLGLLKGLLSQYNEIPIILYMHENQLTHPFSKLDKQKDLDLSYGFLNIKSCCVADKIIFNSNYHKNQFNTASLKLLQKMPDFNNENIINLIYLKSFVSHLGIDFNIIESIDSIKTNNEPTLLWNHRWTFDKRPEIFINLLNKLEERKLSYKLIITNVSNNNTNFQNQIKPFTKNILYKGMCSSYEEYIFWVKQADILPVSSKHDFFGLSVLEAISCGVYPILPENHVYSELYDRHIKLSYYNTTDEFYMKTIQVLEQKRYKNLEYRKSSQYRSIKKDFSIKSSVANLDSLIQ